MTDGLKLYTVSQIRDWLSGTSLTEGLDEYVITRSRAKAIVNNPYVTADDVVASAIYEGGELAAYTATFPDMIDGKRSWWFSTLWCAPKHQGKGFGLIAIGSICECHEGEPIFDMWGAEETVQIFRCLGLKDTTIPEYKFPRKQFANSLKGKLAACRQSLKRTARPHIKGLKADIADKAFRNQFVDCVDDETWEWISRHNAGDALPRSREMLNWILSNPFVVTATGNPGGREEFSDVATEYLLSGVKVFQGGTFVGFYILRWNGLELSIKYNWSNHPAILASIGSQWLKFRPKRFNTRDADIAEYIRRWNLFPDGKIEQISFSYPQDFILMGRIQSGDADNFA